MTVCDPWNFLLNFYIFCFKWYTDCSLKIQFLCKVNSLDCKRAINDGVMLIVDVRLFQNIYDNFSDSSVCLHDRHACSLDWIGWTLKKSFHLLSPSFCLSIRLLLQKAVKLLSGLSYVTKNSANNITRTIYLLKKFFYLVDKLSARGWQLNTVLQLSTISWDFVLNILLKALFIAKSRDLVCDLLTGQDSRL